MASFKANAPGCPCCVTGAPCSPCDIPFSDLHLTLIYKTGSSAHGTVSVTLTYVPGVNPHWATAPVTISDYYAAGPDDPCFSGIVSSHGFTVSCLSGALYLTHTIYCFNPGTPESYDYNYPMTGSVHSCSPFSAHWTGAPLTFSDLEAILTT